MNGSIERSTDQLLSQSSLLLEEIEGMNGLISAGAEDSSPVGSTAHVEAMRRMNETMALPSRGHAELNVSEDEMTATMDFYPPAGDAPTLDLQEIRDMLAANDISVDVNWAETEAALFRCNTDRQPVTDVVVACGRPPVNNELARLVVEPELAEPAPSIVTGENDRIDYRSVSPFQLVKRGQALAKIISAKRGEQGYTVYGKPVACKTIQVTRLALGHDVAQYGETVHAECDGRLSLENNIISVSPVLEIPHDVDLRTGHISFPGDVIVHGDVKSGFKVQSGGTILCLQTIEAAEVSCEKDLIVKRGVVGRQTGSVRAHGSVLIKFAENAFIETRGPIRVDVGILNSIVQTLDRIDLGPRGIIVGGKLTAGNGISAAQIGASLGARTELYCGIDYSVEQKLEWLREKVMLLSGKLRQVTQHIAASPRPREDLEQLREKLKEAVHKINESAGLLVFRLDRNESADVRVTGTVYPGTYVEICHLPYVVTRALHKTRFYLDKAKGKVVAEPW